jgi:uncharacterized protein (DUF1800 family)
MDEQDTLSRKDFLRMGGLAAAMAAMTACKVFEPGGTLPPQAVVPSPAEPAVSVAPTASSLPPLTPMTPTPAPAKILTPTVAAPQTATVGPGIHLALRRITFGPRAVDVAYATKIGLDNFIDEQLAPASIQDEDLDRRLTGLTTLNMEAADLARLDERRQPGLELSQAAILRAVYSKRQLYELMVDFWTNHFSIYIGKGVDRYLKTIDDREVVRPNALGKFPDLLSASAHSPAMLFYLDNYLSNGRQPNENYARELMELHTLGVDGGYIQQDVKEAARALTGWSIAGEKDPVPGIFKYRPILHDDGEKTILGQRFAPGQGVKDGEQLLELLANHPSTAMFVSTKLVRRFVADQPPAALVEKAAQTFRSTNGDLAKVLGVILHSDEFKASLGTKFKRPFEFVVSALRISEADVSADKPIIGALSAMGQPLFRWEPPNGFPDALGAWLTTNGLLGRWNFALALFANRLKDARVDVAALAGNGSPQMVVDRLSERFLGGPLPAEGQAALKDMLASKDVSKFNPALAALIVGSAYFQYR